MAMDTVLRALFDQALPNASTGYVPWFLIWAIETRVVELHRLEFRLKRPDLVIETSA